MFQEPLDFSTGTLAAGLNALREKHGARLLHQPKGDLVVVDRFCRASFRVSQREASEEDETVLLDRVGAFLGEAKENPGPDKYPDVKLHFHGQLPLPVDIIRWLEHMVSGCAGRIDPQAVLHVDAFGSDPSACFEQLTASEQLRGYLQFRGQLPEIEEETADQCVDADMSFYETAGWWTGCTPDQSTQLDTKRIRRNAALGLRLPVLWYVHQDNLPEVPDALQRSLEANYNAGFALLPVCLNPFAATGTPSPRLPNEEAFCDLLVESYQRFPHFDELFEPILDLAWNVRYGGWHRFFEVPRPVNVLLGKDRECRVFRQLPAAAQSWTSVAKALAMSPEDAVDSLLEAAGNNADFADHPYCGGCEWKYVCGGMDRLATCDAMRADVDLVCGYRKLFSEFFLHQKCSSMEQVTE
jgi:hypothetical protein